MFPGMELMNCHSLAVPVDVMHHVVRVESSYNPYAIGVVGGRLVRQPENLPEALATVRMLESQGYNFSLGLAQVNRYNLDKYGLASYAQAFETCPNLQAGSRILAECHSRSGGDWGKSFSCYYSGNFVTGYRHGYVQKIYASMRGSAPAVPAQAIPGAIAVVGRPSRRSAGVSRYPVYAAAQPAPPAAPSRVIATTTAQPQPQMQQPQQIQQIQTQAEPQQPGPETPVLLQLAGRQNSAAIAPPGGQGTQTVPPTGSTYPQDAASTTDEAFVF